MQNPYGNGTAASKIANVLSQLKIDKTFDKGYNLLMTKKNILIVAPHADDETLGCGGTILNHKKR